MYDGTDASLFRRYAPYEDVVPYQKRECYCTEMELVRGGLYNIPVGAEQTLRGRRCAYCFLPAIARNKNIPLLREGYFSTN